MRQLLVNRKVHTWWIVSYLRGALGAEDVLAIAAVMLASYERELLATRRAVLSRRVRVPALLLHGTREQADDLVVVATYTTRRQCHQTSLSSSHRSGVPKLSDILRRIALESHALVGASSQQHGDHVSMAFLCRSIQWRHTLRTGCVGIGTVM